MQTKRNSLFVVGLGVVVGVVGYILYKIWRLPPKTPSSPTENISLGKNKDALSELISSPRIINERQTDFKVQVVNMDDQYNTTPVEEEGSDSGEDIDVPPPVEELSLGVGGKTLKFLERSGIRPKASGDNLKIPPPMDIPLPPPQVYVPPPQDVPPPFDLPPVPPPSDVPSVPSSVVVLPTRDKPQLLTVPPPLDLPPMPPPVVNVPVLPPRDVPSPPVNLPSLLNVPPPLDLPPIPPPVVTSPNTKIYWEYKHKGKWVIYSPNESRLLEQAFKNNQSQLQLKTNTATYDIDLIQKKQKSNQDDPEEIRRQIIVYDGNVLKKGRVLKWKLTNLVLTPTSLLLYMETAVKEIPVDSIKNFSHDENNLLTITTATKNYQITTSMEEYAKQWTDIFYKVREKTPALDLGLFFLDPLEEAGRYSIAFPSISTVAFQFNVEIASDVACEVISEFLVTHMDPRLNLILVDLNDTPTLQLFRRKSPKDSRFHIRVANLVTLKDLKLPCWYIVNASNQKLNDGGSGTNAAIHNACSGNYTLPLKNLTLQLYNPPAEVGKAYPVDLPRGCPLRDKQNVHTVIHVAGPNMNPKKKNYLNEDYVKGKELLRQSYENMLNCFYERAFGSI